MPYGILDPYLKKKKKKICMKLSLNAFLCGADSMPLFLY